MRLALRWIAVVADEFLARLDADELGAIVPLFCGALEEPEFGDVRERLAGTARPTFWAFRQAYSGSTSVQSRGASTALMSKR